MTNFELLDIILKLLSEKMSRKNLDGSDPPCSLCVLDLQYTSPDKNFPENDKLDRSISYEKFPPFCLSTPSPQFLKKKGEKKNSL